MLSYSTHLFDSEEESIKIFTDGGCRGNGSPDSIGTSAVVIFAANIFKSIHFTKLEQLPKPTNNRAEWTAIIIGLTEGLKFSSDKRIELITDSNNCMQTLLVWYENRLKLGTQEQMINHDLIVKAYELYKKFGDRINILHINSHKKRPQSKDYDDLEKYNKELFYWKGNYIVDDIAGILLKRDIDETDITKFKNIFNDIYKNYKIIKSAKCL